MSNVDKYRSAHQAFNRRDWTALLQNFAADANYADRRAVLQDYAVQRGGQIISGSIHEVSTKTWSPSSFS
ncbi:MAG: hypothetical protein M3332_05100 [Actinomycetota bacterium]|nr:hypothetical protein [Actinomycetota bacterium]